MPLTEIAIMIKGINDAITIVKSLKPSDKVQALLKIRSDILENLEAIRVGALTLQEERFAIIKEKDELAKKILEFENWANTERNYELTEIARQSFVYRSKKSDQSTEPMHYLCPNCYQERKKSILQYKGPVSGFSCHKCHFHIKSPGDDNQVHFMR